MGTSLLFKRTALFFTLYFTCIFIFAQENRTDLENDWFGELGVAYGFPMAYGDNFLADGYDIGNGANVDTKVLVSSKWLVGAQWSYFKGNVVDISKVGGIDNTGISHLLVTGNYSLLEKSNPIQLRTGLGVGYVLYAHEKSNTKFKDDGFSLVANFDIAYKLNNSFGLFLKIDNYWDFLSIDTAPELKSAFGRTQTLVPFIGIRWYTF